jgi:glycosyltransferase involved in cell wall biosynthesis
VEREGNIFHDEAGRTVASNPAALRAQWDATVRRYGARVTHVGAVPERELERLMAASHLFVLPSWSEGVPMSMLEALAIGLPVVVTRVGGIPDVVRDREHGRLIRPGEPAALADAVISMAADRSEAARVGRANRAYASRALNPEHVRLALAKTIVGACRR